MTTERSDVRGIIRNWWRHEIGDRQSSAARALAARLRRATAIEVLTEPAVHQLAEQLGNRNPETIHRIVAVLAHVREDGALRLPQKLGALRRDDSPNLRFQQLMRAEGEALTTALIRTLPMISNACNVGSLGEDLFFWNDKTRARWTFDYFGAPAPESLEETPE